MRQRTTCYLIFCSSRVPPGQGKGWWEAKPRTIPFYVYQPLFQSPFQGFVGERRSLSQSSSFNKVKVGRKRKFSSYSIVITIIVITPKCLYKLFLYSLLMTSAGFSRAVFKTRCNTVRQMTATFDAIMILSTPKLGYQIIIVQEILAVKHFLCADCLIIGRFTPFSVDLLSFLWWAGVVKNTFDSKITNALWKGFFWQYW